MVQQQSYVSNVSKTQPRIEAHPTIPFTYYVKSFSPKKAQLSYLVILSDTEVHCTCEAFKYGKGIMCKHLMLVLQTQARVTEATA